MLHAIAKMTTDAAGAVTDAAGAVADNVGKVLPIGKSGDNDDTSEPADADVARDQDIEPNKANKKKSAGKDQKSEGPVSRPLAEAPTMSGDLDVAGPTPLRPLRRSRPQRAKKPL